MRIEELGHDGASGGGEEVESPRVSKIALLSAKRAVVGVGARVLFYPTLLYNVLRNKIQSEFHWWDPIDEDYINTKYNISSASSSWFVFGVSYSGALSAWFRLKFPHPTCGSLASSGVVLAVYNFTEFNQQLLALANGDRVKDKQISRSSFVVDMDKKLAAENPLNELSSCHGPLIQQCCRSRAFLSSSECICFRFSRSSQLTQKPLLSRYREQGGTVSRPIKVPAIRSEMQLFYLSKCLMSHIGSMMYSMVQKVVMFHSKLDSPKPKIKCSFSRHRLQI